MFKTRRLSDSGIFAATQFAQSSLKNAKKNVFLRGIDFFQMQHVLVKTISQHAFCSKFAIFFSN